MANNRFAELSPDYEEEEKKRQKELKEAQAKREALQKKEEAEKARRKEEAEREEQGEEQEQSGQRRGRGQGRRREGGRGRGEGYHGRGRGEWRGEWRGEKRGEGRGERGRWRGGERRQGRFHQASHYKEEEHGPAQKVKGQSGEDYRGRDHKYTGNPNAKHPYDRHSGTGHGTEIPKGGRGAGNWGNPEDDVKNEKKYEKELVDEPKEAEQEEKQEKEKEKEKEKEAKGKDKKKQKKKRKEKEEEEKKEEKDTGPVFTLSEYKAMQAENMQGLTTKKPEEQIAKDPKAVAGLKPHEKEKFASTSVAVHKKKKKEKEQVEENKKVELGMETGGSYPYKPRYKEKPYGKDGDYHKQAPKKTEKVPFVLNEKDFPAL